LICAIAAAPFEFSFAIRALDDVADGSVKSGKNATVDGHFHSAQEFLLQNAGTAAGSRSAKMGFLSPLGSSQRDPLPNKKWPQAGDAFRHRQGRRHLAENLDAIVRSVSGENPHG
jgi:hypothetical protein